MSGGRFDARVRELLDEAEEALAAGDAAAAGGLTRAALALQDDDARALDLLARLEPPRAGERRQLTVMFCDVVGSTRLAHDHDPELVREVLRAYQATCDEAVRRYEGRIARYIGDGILAYFGHPIAHEDDARRGVKAGLDLLQALRPVTQEVGDRYGIELAVRVAVHTGVVVVGEMGTATTPDRDAIVGETPNLAARLQDHARPGSLVISEATYDLVRGWFLVAPLGRLDLRGIEGPVDAFEVVEELQIESRIEARADLSPFVGRDEETGLLLGAWAEVRAGGNRTVVLQGQPGIGKTRLTDVVRRRVEADGGTALLASCSAYHRATSLFPIRRLLERTSGIVSHVAVDSALPRLWTMLESVGQAGSAPLLAELLELPPTSWCPSPELDGTRLYEELLGALVGLLTATAARQPLVFVVDDLQWADASTLDLITRGLASGIPGLLMVLTAREEFEVPWRSADHVHVEPLAPSDLEALARRLPDGRRLSPDELQRAIERSDGVPFFFEELLRSTALERAPGRAGADIPAALRDLLLARFAAPGVDFAVAQQVATIGGEAAVPVLAGCLRCHPSEVEGKLAPLVDAGILVPIEGASAGFRFRHHLLEAIAYDTQLRAARERAHSTVADILRSEALGVAAAPSVIAGHLELAGRLDEAVEALVDAAEESLEIGAQAEVAALLERALELIGDLEGDRAVELEVRVRLLRGTSVASTLGFAAPQAVEDFETCERMVGSVSAEVHIDEVTPEEAPGPHAFAAALVGMWSTVILQGRLEAAEQINERLRERVRPQGPAADYINAAGTAFPAFYRGHVTTALAAFEKQVEASRSYAMPRLGGTPNDQLTASQAHLGYARILAGHADAGRSDMEAALAGAASMPFPQGPFTSCMILGMRSAIEVVLGDLDVASESARLEGEIAERHGFTFWALFASLHEALVAVAKGDVDRAPQAQMTIQMLQALGVHSWVPTLLGTLADQLLIHGDRIGAAPLVLEALRVGESTGARLWTTDGERIRGELAVADGDDTGLVVVEAAAERARSEGARFFELRARTTLCQLDPSTARSAALAAVLEGVDLGPDVPARRSAESVLAD